MKYCPRCKLRVPETSETCSKCGGGLRRFGAPAPSGSGTTPAPATTVRPSAPPSSRPSASDSPALPKVPAPGIERPSASPAPVLPVAASPTMELPGEAHLRLELSGLKAEVARTRRWVAWWWVAAAVLLTALVGTLVELRRRAVLEFATVAEVRVNAVPGNADAAEIVFRPTSAGKIEFTRVAPGGSETVVEHIDDRSSRETAPRSFTWSGASRDYRIRVRTRQGFSIVANEFGPPAPRIESGDLF